MSSFRQCRENLVFLSITAQLNPFLQICDETYTSKPRLLNLILLNLIVRWLTGVAIVRPSNTEYTQSIGACWEKLPKIVKITILQFNYQFGHTDSRHSGLRV